MIKVAKQMKPLDTFNTNFYFGCD